MGCRDRGGTAGETETASRGWKYPDALEEEEDGRAISMGLGMSGL